MPSHFKLRGGSDDDDFPSRDITMKQVRTVSKIPWEKWGPMVGDYSPRDMLALAYVEGLYHGAMIAIRDPAVRDTIQMTAGSASSAAASAASSSTTETETLSVRDLLELT